MLRLSANPYATHLVVNCTIIVYICTCFLEISCDARLSSVCTS